MTINFTLLCIIQLLVVAADSLLAKPTISPFQALSYSSTGTDTYRDEAEVVASFGEALSTISATQRCYVLNNSP